MSWKLKLWDMDAERMVDPRGLSSAHVRILNRIIQVARPLLRTNPDTEAVIDKVNAFSMVEDWPVEAEDLLNFVSVLACEGEGGREGETVTDYCDAVRYWASRSEIDYATHFGRLEHYPNAPHLPKGFLIQVIGTDRRVLAIGPERAAIWVTGDQRQWCGLPYVIPMPLVDDYRHGEGTPEITPTDIAEWRLTVADFPPQDVRGVMKAILNADIKVVAITTTPALALQAIFRIEAANKDEWDQATGGLWQRLTERGVQVSEFSFDRQARVPSETQHLIYLSDPILGLCV